MPALEVSSKPASYRCTDEDIVLTSELRKLFEMIRAVTRRQRCNYRTCVVSAFRIISDREREDSLNSSLEIFRDRRDHTSPTN